MHVGCIALQCAAVAQVSTVVQPVCVALHVWRLAPSQRRSPGLQTGKLHFMAAGSHWAGPLHVWTNVKSLRASLHRSRLAALHRYWLTEHAGGTHRLPAASQSAGVAQADVVAQPD
jgi:hypothetical protein